MSEGADRARLAVFVSGFGSTLENLIACARTGTLDARVSLVVASRPCRGVAIAREHGVPFHVHTGTLGEAELLGLVDEHRLDWIALAGYLKLLPIPARLEGRVVNIHPSLLPAFGGPGMHGGRVHEAVAAAAERGEITETGCTVHLCDATYDTGPIVLQARCPVAPGDAPDEIAARVGELERRAYPEALNRLIAGETAG